MRLYLLMYAMTFTPFLLWGQGLSVPYVQDFERFSPCIPSCFSSCNLPEGWQNAQNDRLDWIVDARGTPTAHTGPSGDFLPGSPGGKYLYLESLLGCMSRKSAYLLSPAFDLRTTRMPVVEFFYHMYGYAQGSLHLDVDTGGVWVEDILPPLRDNLDAWQRANTCLPWLAGRQEVRFRIRGITGLAETSDMAIDAFRLWDGLPQDLVLEKISVNHCSPDRDEPISFRVSNTGRNPIRGFEARFAIAPSTYGPAEHFHDTLYPCQSRIYTFSRAAGLSFPGNYRIQVALSINGQSDDRPETDSLEIAFATLPRVTSYPYRESFEKGPAGWTANGQNNSWQHGIPAGPIINRAAHGAYAWGTNLKGNYNSRELSYLTSPCFDFRSLKHDPVLTFYHSFYLEKYHDLHWLEISYDAGKNWKKLGNHRSGLAHWYDSALASWNHLSGGIGLWRQAAHRLTGAAGKMIQLRFVLYSDGQIRREGVVIDDVHIFPGRDVSVEAILSPRDTCGSGHTAKEYVKIRLTNKGYHDISGLQLAFQIDPPTGFISIVETLNLPLVAGASLDYTFRTRADLRTKRPHVVWAYLAQADEYPGNDSMSQSAGSFDLPLIQLRADTTICHGDSLRLSPAYRSDYRYHWSTGDSSREIWATQSTIYYLAVEDSNACVSRDSIQLSIPPPLEAQSLVENVDCYGNATGSISLDSLTGGLPPLRVLWENGDSALRRSALPAGTYVYRLSDAMACQWRDSVAVKQPPPLALAIDRTEHAGCPYDSIGAIFVTPMGGVTPYHYRWSNGARTEDISRLGEGDYRLQIQDANNCPFESELISITTPDTLPIANFNYDIIGGRVLFDDASFNAQHYTWLFGDGDSASGVTNPMHDYSQNGNYTVSLITSNSCGSDTITKMIVLRSVGVHPGVDQGAIRIAPHPILDGVLRLLSEQGLHKVHLRLYDIQGRLSWQAHKALWHKGEALHHTLPPQIKPGIYLLQIQHTKGLSHHHLWLR